MQWERLLSSKRFGNETFKDNRSHDRSEFQRDYDRLIFSSPFRRLQNKTQVFPLPGSVFVHNRLTHSLEVSSVGRSLGLAVSRELRKRHQLEHDEALTEMGDIVSAACLAHDLGNPPFGHSGEKAIASYFLDGEGLKYKELLSESEYADFACFEGNANAFRLLTHQFKGRRPGGFALTYSTLASIVKYPYASVLANPSHAKFGFFCSETTGFEKIADELGLLRIPDAAPRYCRHPLVFLVEAADDICYQIMDLEDAHKLKLISTEETRSLMLNYFEGERLTRIMDVLHLVEDVNEQIAYLRSCVIGRLIKACTSVFLENEQAILDGAFTRPLIKHIDEKARSAFEAIATLSFERIYRSSDVLDIELAGYRIISTLLHEVTQAVMNPDKAYSKVLLARIPSQYEVRSESVYNRLQAVVDYVSGMTDVYALDLYQKMTGTSLPAL